MADGPAVKKGDQFGGWTVHGDAPLGSGGQAVVWKAKATNVRHAPPVALKICTDRDAKARSRFDREIDLLEANRHPGIVSLRDRGERDGVPFYAMEFANSTIDRVVTQEQVGNRVLCESPALLLRFFAQACNAVAHLHANNVLHRDIKPSNLLLVLNPPEPMRAVVSDLGIAAAEDSQGDLTRTREVLGSPGYRAPEVLYAKRHTKASDVYSLGKTLEFILNRRAPTDLEPGRCSRHDGIDDLLWDQMDDVLARACAFDPKDRIPDAAGLLEAFPSIVVGVRTGSAASKRTGVGRTMHESEARILHVVIGACLAESVWLSAWELQRRTSDFGVSEYDLAMGFRSLKNLGFVMEREADDERGNRFLEVRASSRGLEWAAEHPDTMRFPASTGPVPSPDSSDIPF